MTDAFRAMFSSYLSSFMSLFISLYSFSLPLHSSSFFHHAFIIVSWIPIKLRILDFNRSISPQHCIEYTKEEKTQWIWLVLSAYQSAFIVKGMFYLLSQYHQHRHRLWPWKRNTHSKRFHINLHSLFSLPLNTNSEEYS